LDSLLAQRVEARDCMVTVVDNCSRDGSAEKLKRYASEKKTNQKLQTFFLPENIGFAGGMNFGASKTSGEWLVLVNSDTVFAPNALGALYRSLKYQPPNVGMVGPVTNSAGTGQMYIIDGAREAILDFGRELQSAPTGQSIRCDRLDFFCVAIRRFLWERLGGLDITYGLGYYEDNDFSARASAIGSELVICEDVFVFHAGGVSFLEEPSKIRLMQQNKKIFLKRFPSAKLLHSRECNFEVLEEYLELRNRGVWNTGLQLRTELRVRKLLADRPRGLCKRFFWNKKISAMKHLIAQTT